MSRISAGPNAPIEVCVIISGIEGQILRLALARYMAALSENAIALDHSAAVEVQSGQQIPVTAIAIDAYLMARKLDKELANLGFEGMK